MSVSALGGSSTDLAKAFSSPFSSKRLAAALAAGSQPNQDFVEVLIVQASVEPDFFVRDMLTWALLRQDLDKVFVRVQDELRSSIPQARSQALHTLTKTGKSEAWKLVSDDLLFDKDSSVRRAAWRVASMFTPGTEREILAKKLIPLLGLGDEDEWMSLSRALALIGEDSEPLLRGMDDSPDARIATHARFTLDLISAQS